LGRRLVKRRFAQALVDSIGLCRQPGVIENWREELVGRPKQCRLSWQPDRILRRCKCFHHQAEVREDPLDHRQLVKTVQEQ
jgi:hypothetical protein